MNKTEAVHHTKRANNRLKPVSDTCIRIINYPDWKEAKKHLMRCFARLDRELGPDDTEGPALRKALDDFYNTFVSDYENLTEDHALNVYKAVRIVQSQRWRRLEAKYGPVRHYFDGFGQIKPQYKKHKQDQNQVEPPRGCLILVLLIIGFIVWWLVF
ncbi:hypothetical protein [Desulfonatronovibrio magnus]|uniref:hypothetical protein n=1 Tax=Desulfonatronovibrio magnus TaxID=698827 RepID=UPI0005EBD112|nr:hypothetical protein [Desulfonatronovibrio magnus]